MAKYSFEFKKKVVTAYLSGEGGAEFLAKKFGVKHKSSVDGWIKYFQAQGDEGLLRSRQNKDYSFEYKCSIVELYLIRKSRKYSSYKGKVGTVAPNRIRRRFNTSIPHQKITTDTSEFKYYEIDDKGHMTMHKLYTDPFMDMCNGEIISFEVGSHPSAKNVMNALGKAIETTSDCPYRRTFHSDQGWAYQMKAYSHRLREEHIFQSMSRKGNCYDNSVMENFFGLLKQEIYYGVVYYSYDELKSEIERFIKYYNEQRIKQKLGWLSPVQYRLNLLVA